MTFKCLTCKWHSGKDQDLTKCKTCERMCDCPDHYTPMLKGKRTLSEKQQYFKAEITFYVIHKKGKTLDALDISAWFSESIILFMLSAVTKSMIRIKSNDRINVGGLIKTTMLERKPSNIIFPSFDMTIPKGK